MGKPFQIDYSPASWTTPAGGVATSWTMPYGGLNVETPPNLISPSQTPSMSNFMFRNAELRSRPNFKIFLPSPDNNPILGVASFLSKNVVWHTVCWTVNGMYQLQPGISGFLALGQSPWRLVGGPQMTPGIAVTWRVFQNILYWSNNGHLAAWDGAALQPVNDAAFLGAGVSGLPPSTTTLLGCLFLGELDNHIILASTIETPVTSGVPGATNSFTQRIRWSNNGFNPFGGGAFGSNFGTPGATFDPSVFPNAGSNDFLDVPDQITGTMYVGRVGYIFRQNGITEISPTGNGTAPFDFNHMWASELGIGNVYSGTIAQYGDHGVFIANDNVYMIAGGSVQPIGGGTRDAIFADLASTTAPPTAVIVPALTLGYVYLTYMLFVLLPTGDTRVYVYSFEDNNWAQWLLAGQSIGLPYPCWIGDSTVQTTTQQIVTAGSQQTGGGSGGGHPGGGGPRCIDVEMYVGPKLQAGDVMVGDALRGLSDGDFARIVPWMVEWTEQSEEPCYRLVTENGAELILSAMTPIPVLEWDGNDMYVVADLKEGLHVLTECGEGLEWAALSKVESVGVRRVARLYCGGHNYAAGKEPGKWIYSHNFLPNGK